MARVVFGTYLFRYPLGGYAAHVLAYLAGLSRLGHDVIVVERANHPNDCFDPDQQIMTDDCSAGIMRILPLLSSLGLQDKWCFVGADGTSHGLTDRERSDFFKTADVFLDYGAHGSFAEEFGAEPVRVLIDGEPGRNQIRLARPQSPVPPTNYDVHFTVGLNIGTPRSPAPTAGLQWHHMFHPVDTRVMRPTRPPRPDAAFTTVMNWQSHEPIAWDGSVFGQKDLEFRRFEHLPLMTSAPLEIAVSGHAIPLDRLQLAGWRIVDGHAASDTLQSYTEYIENSAGEFSVCKQYFAALRTGWFSDRSAAYLSMARPVILQETGFSEHLPTGEGLFAVNNAEEAAEAIDCVRTNPAQHSRAAREIAREYLDAPVVVEKMLDKIAAHTAGQ